jgi:hypothetical protein
MRLCHIDQYWKSGRPKFLRCNFCDEYGFGAYSNYSNNNIELSNKNIELSNHNIEFHLIKHLDKIPQKYICNECGWISCTIKRKKEHICSNRQDNIN